MTDQLIMDIDTAICEARRFIQRASAWKKLLKSQSAIYPSKMAASIAIPDVEKSWEMAKAEGNILNIELPFLIKDKETLSICGYLYHLFNLHRAVSHGLFSVGRLALSAEKKDGDSESKTIKDEMASDYKIEFTAWLAPFDLGIMQQVDFNVSVSPGFKGYKEIGMTIVRKSGEHNTWWRVNKRFVNLIRKQLLIWRSMDAAEKQAHAASVESHITAEDTPVA